MMITENPWLTILILVGFTLALVYVLVTIFSSRRVAKAERIRNIDEYIEKIKNE